MSLEKVIGKWEKSLFNVIILGCLAFVTLSNSGCATMGVPMTGEIKREYKRNPFFYYLFNSDSGVATGSLIGGPGFRLGYAAGSSKYYDGTYNCELIDNEQEKGVLVRYINKKEKDLGSLFFNVPINAEKIGINFGKAGNAAVLVYELDGVLIRKDYTIFWSVIDKGKSGNAKLKDKYYMKDGKWLKETAEKEQIFRK